MADNNLPGEPGPVVTTPPTYDQQVEDISNLLDDPVTDPAEEPEDSEAAPPETPEDDDPLGLDGDAEDVETEDADDPDGSEGPDIKGGRFAPHTAKVTLDDGTVTTVAELVRNNLYQRDYTKKTTEHAEALKAFEAQKSEVSQQAQSLAEFRDYAAWYAETHLPQQPEPFKGNRLTDPMGYLAWSEKNDEWQAHAQAYQAFQQQKIADEQRKTGETQKQAQERLGKEREALLKAIPVLKDPVKGKVAWAALVSGAKEHYGFTEEEVNTIGDHRMFLVVRDALKAKRIEAKAHQVQAEVTQKPAMRSGRRASPQAAETKARQVRSERLRTSGSFQDGIAALQDLDL